MPECDVCGETFDRDETLESHKYFAGHDEEAER